MESERTTTTLAGELNAAASPQKCILLVEDDRSVRRYLEVTLLRAGYKVITAEDGLAGMKCALSSEVNAVITDAVMPQMSGRRFADSLRAAHPNIKVLFISGYLEESLQPGDRCEPGMFFLPKPFDSEQLAMKVRQALDP